MAFSWYGRGNADGKVWEREIHRYQFTSNETVNGLGRFGEITHIEAGRPFKISKREAHQFFNKGYVEVRASHWNSVQDRWEPIKIRLSNGKVTLDIEKSVLTEHEVTPESVAPKRKGK